MSDASAVSVLSAHGKSFRFAGFFLPQQQLQQAARLYAFCRTIDDIADEATDKLSALQTLESIKQALLAATPTHPLVHDFLSLQREFNIPSVLPIQLIEGVKSDLNTVSFDTTEELLRYSYRVAGVVGRMMCPLLGADHAGLTQATHLGIAMQLTNIARDVFEDAHMGRRYLPATWCTATAQEIVDNDCNTQQHVTQAIRKLLALSECYYRSGWQGLRYLPKQSRTAIAIAAAVYREIGIQLGKKQYCYWQGRIRVSTWRKLAIATSVFTNNNYLQEAALPTAESALLHTAIADLLPNTSAHGK